MSLSRLNWIRKWSFLEWNTYAWLCGVIESRDWNAFSIPLVKWAQKLFFFPSINDKNASTIFVFACVRVCVCVRGIKLIKSTISLKIVNGIERSWGLTTTKQKEKKCVIESSHVFSLCERVEKLSLNTLSLWHCLNTQFRCLFAIHRWRKKKRLWSEKKEKKVINIELNEQKEKPIRPTHYSASTNKSLCWMKHKMFEVRRLVLTLCKQWLLCLRLPCHNLLKPCIIM